MIYAPQYQGREQFVRRLGDKAVGVVIYRFKTGSVIARFAPDQYMKLAPEHQTAV